MHCIDAKTVKSAGRHVSKIALCVYTHARTLVQDIKGMKAVPEYRKFHDRVTEYTSFGGVKALETLRLRWAGQVFFFWGGGRGNA